MTRLFARARRLAEDDSGATMIEYALMVAFVAAVCVVAVTAFGSGINGAFNMVAGLF